MTWKNFVNLGFLPLEVIYESLETNILTPEAATGGVP